MFTMYHRPRGPMDKASDFESEDCGFDPHRGHFTHFKHCSLEPRVMVPNRWMVIDCFSIVGSVVEFSPATREARVQFPDDAIIFVESCNHNIMQTGTCIFFFYQMYD